MTERVVREWDRDTLAGLVASETVEDGDHSYAPNGESNYTSSFLGDPRHASTLDEAINYNRNYIAPSMNIPTGTPPWTKTSLHACSIA